MERRLTAKDRQQVADRVILATFIINFALMGFKFLAGILGRSGAMISDAAHTLSDLLTTVLAFFGIRIASRASDANHPYGHEKVESVTGLLLAFILAVTAIMIGKGGVEALIAGPSEMGAPGVIALIAALVSIITQEGMYRLAYRAGKRIDSPAIMADAWHHRSDALSSIGALIGIGCARVGLWFMEPVASLLICALILKTAFDIGKSSVEQLTDVSAGQDELEDIKRIVLSVDGVEHIDGLKTRKHASFLYVDVEIALSNTLSFEEAHILCERVHERVEAEAPKVLHCTVHANPHTADGEEVPVPGQDMV